MKSQTRKLLTIALLALVASGAGGAVAASAIVARPDAALPAPAATPTAAAAETAVDPAIVTPMHFFPSEASVADGCRWCLPWGVFPVCMSDPTSYCSQCIQECIAGGGSGACEINSNGRCTCICDKFLSVLRGFDALSLSTE